MLVVDGNRSAFPDYLASNGLTDGAGTARYEKNSPFH
jgi:hypothetical protein